MKTANVRCENNATTTAELKQNGWERMKNQFEEEKQVELIKMHKKSNMQKKQCLGTEFETCQCL